MSSVTRALALAMVGCCLSTSLMAEPLAERLIALRGEVEQLNVELDLLREEQRSVLAGLNAQRAELKASADRQQLLARDAQAKLDAALAEAASRGASADALSPLLQEAIDALQQHIAAALPFKLDERLAALQALRLDLGNGSLSGARAANRLWAFFEDEFRLTRENGLHNQTIEVGGERVLAEVAKLGSMLLYFRTPDGRLGQAVSVGEGWRFQLATDEVQRRKIGGLFDSLRKQIRQGYFELPQLATSGAAR